MAAVSSRLAQLTRRIVRPTSRSARSVPTEQPLGTYRHLYVEGVTPADRWAKRYLGEAHR